MQFTEKEINLAKQLKEAGLEWKPQRGDWCLYNGELRLIDDTTTDEVCCGFIGRRKASECIWLPLWNQCRELFRKVGMHGLGFSVMPRGTDVILTLWKTRNSGGIDFYQQYFADTDLEAMYRALLDMRSDRENLTPMSADAPEENQQLIAVPNKTISMLDELATIDAECDRTKVLIQLVEKHYKIKKDLQQWQSDDAIRRAIKEKFQQI